MRAVLAIALLTGASVALAAPAASYDPWAWLLWGREVAHGTLSTAEGPAFKPLPVAATTVLAALGGAAPVAWVLLARAGALAALLLAFRLGRGLAGGAAAAGVLAAVGVASTGGFGSLAASGHSEGLLLALALGAAEAWRRGRLGWALLLGAGCALLRVEAWPFLLPAAAVLWRRGALRGALAAGVVLVPAAWFVPELLGSGDLLRSGDRARVPNPGQPALAAFPLGASLRDALALVQWPVWPGLAAAAWLRPRALWPAAAGAGWITLVAVMAQAGFSGEARYAMPGAALVVISGATGLALAVRRATEAASGVALIARAGAVAVIVATMVVARGDELREIRGAQAHAWRLQEDLPAAIAAAGGREAVLACGRPYVGRLRGPLLAYGLDVEKRAIEPDEPPRPPGTAFRSPLREGDPVTPPRTTGFTPVAQAGAWRVEQQC